MSSPMPPPLDGNANRGPQIMAILWSMTAAAAFVVLVRFYARMSIRALGIDDWTMLFTWVNFAVSTALITVQALHGGDRHLFYIPLDEQTFIVKITWVSQPFAIMSITLGKVSVAFLILRLIGRNPRWPRYCLYSAIASCLVVSSIDIILTYVQCSPVKALWDPSIPHSCWNPTLQSNFALFCASWLIFIDACLATLPIFIFRKLHMSPRKKWGICALLGCGYFSAIAGAIKTSTLSSLSKHADITWATYDAYVWAGAECFVLIVCGSVPPMKILWDRYHSSKTTQISLLRYNNISESNKAQSYPHTDSSSDAQKVTTSSSEAEVGIHEV